MKRFGILLLACSLFAACSKDAAFGDNASDQPVLTKAVGGPMGIYPNEPVANEAVSFICINNGAVQQFRYRIVNEANQNVAYTNSFVFSYNHTFTSPGTYRIIYQLYGDSVQYTKEFVVKPVTSSFFEIYPEDGEIPLRMFHEIRINAAGVLKYKGNRTTGHHPAYAVVGTFIMHVNFCGPGEYVFEATVNGVTEEKVIKVTTAI